MKKNKKVDCDINELYDTSLNDIVRVHCKAFSSSMLTKFGKDVVREYYRWQFDSDDSVYIVGALVKDKLIAFCVSGNFSSSLIGFIRKNKLFLIKSLIKKPHFLFNCSILKRVFFAAKLYISKILFNDITKYKINKNFGIQSVAIDPTFHRNGIGTKLISNCESFARDEGYEIIQLSVLMDNLSAIDFYDKLGYKKKNPNDWNGKMYKKLK